MKAKITGYLSELVVMGVGVLITQIADTWAWIGFSLIGVGLFGIVITALWGKWYAIPVIRVEKRRRTRATEELIVRQITYINASPFISGNAEYLDVGLIFPSFLLKKLELAKVRGYITVDGNATEEQEFRPMTLFEHSPNEIQLRVALTPNVSAKVRERIQTCSKVEISLHLTGWDVKNKRYDLSTRGWTTKFLT